MNEKEDSDNDDDNKLWRKEMINENILRKQ